MKNKQKQEEKFRKWTQSLLTIERKTMTIEDLRKAFKLQDENTPDNKLKK